MFIFWGNYMYDNLNLIEETYRINMNNFSTGYSNKYVHKQVFTNQYAFYHTRVEIGAIRFNKFIFLMPVHVIIFWFLLLIRHLITNSPVLHTQITFFTAANSPTVYHGTLSKKQLANVFF